MIRTLRRKFVLITMILVSLVLMGVFFGIWQYNKTNMKRQGYMALQMALERRNGEESWFEIGGEVPEGYNRDPVFVVSVEASGRATVTSSDRINVDPNQLSQIVSLVLDTGESQGELLDYDLRYLMKYENNGNVRIAFASMSFERSMIRGVALITAVCVAGAFVVFFIASLLLSRWVLRPVEQSWAQQKRFVADASHELKTPLTIILANTGILKSGSDTDGEQMLWIDSTEKEARRMKALVDDMLFLAKGDDSSPQPEKIVVDFSAVVNTEALAFESVAFEKGLSLKVEAEAHINVLCDPAQLKQLAAILVDNAVKYAVSNSEICVSTKKQQSSAILSVFNEGEPISLDQQKHMFERFYRADMSRSTEGSGLGLSIAKAITDEHRGKISVQSDAYGTVFTVSLPIYERK